MSKEVKRYEPASGLDSTMRKVEWMRETPAGGWVSHDDYNALLAERQWNSVEDRLPETGQPVLAFYRNQIGKGRRICAEYLAPKSRVADQLSDPDTESVEYDEEAGEYYWLPGWYERIDNWEEYSHLTVTEGDISHWMPPPPLCKESSHEQGSEAVPAARRHDSHGARFRAGDGGCGIQLLRPSR